MRYIHFLYYREIPIKSLEDFLLFIPRLFLLIVLLSLKFIFHKQHELENEDIKWSKLINKRKGRLPSAMEAIKFSFENYPEYLYQLNNEELPFGCHDWYKYYNFLFYKDIINEN